MGEIHDLVVAGDIASLDRYLANDPISVNSRSDQGYTPLQLAVLSSNPEVVKFLLEHGADQSLTSPMYVPTIQMATGEHSSEIKELLSQHWDPIGGSDSSGTLGVDPMPVAAQDEKRYPILMFCAEAFKFIGVLSAIGGFVMGLIAASATGAFSSAVNLGGVPTNDLPGFLLFVMPFINGLVACLVWFAAGELLKLFMDIERNSRRA